MKIQSNGLLPPSSRLYHNINQFSMMKNPDIYNYLNCKNFDNIVLNVNENENTITSSKKYLNYYPN